MQDLTNCKEILKKSGSSRWGINGLEEYERCHNLHINKSEGLRDARLEVEKYHLEDTPQYQQLKKASQWHPKGWNEIPHDNDELTN